MADFGLGRPLLLARGVWGLWPCCGQVFSGVCAFAALWSMVFYLVVLFGGCVAAPGSRPYPLNDLSIVFKSPSSVKHCKVENMRGGRGSRLQELLRIMAWASQCHTFDAICVLMIGACWFCVWSGGRGVSCSWTINQKVKCATLHNLPKALKQLKNICK